MRRHRWLAVGDTVRLTVHEIRCTYDSCTATAVRGQVGGFVWSMSDSTVARLGVVRHRLGRTFVDSSIVAVGVRVGR